MTATVLLTSGCAKDTLTRLTTKKDEFSQNAAAAIDVLWVIDNSESMGQEQNGLGASFQAFIDTLATSSVDYHIGVISTDPADEGRLHMGPRNIAYITNETSDPEGAFLQNVKVGTSGARAEKAFETAAMALGKGAGWEPGEPATPPNTGFLRDEAALFIIMVSDEDDNSFGPVDYYRRLFESYKGAGNEARISVSAIAGPTVADEGAVPGCFDPQRGSAEPGYRYADLAGQTNGIFASICADFNDSLTSLSITAAGLDTFFELSSLPNQNVVVDCGNLTREFLCVRVNGEPMARGDNRTGWTYDPTSNSIVFGTSSIPPPQAKILVEYQEVRQ